MAGFLGQADFSEQEPVRQDFAASGVTADEALFQESMRSLSLGQSASEVVQQHILLDLADAINSAQAIHLVESFVRLANDPESHLSEESDRVELNVGELFLSQSVLLRMNQILKQSGFFLDTVYSTVPQTQQSALDEGVFVKERPNQTPLFRGRDLLAKRPMLLVTEELTRNEAQSKTLFLEETLSDLGPKQPALKTGLPTTYIRQNLRSGQLVQCEGHLVVIGDVHNGSEIEATGDICVWGELRGIAHAGSAGDERAEIRALKIEALQLRIGKKIARRPDRVFNHKADDVETAATIRPEVARVVRGEIQILPEVFS